MYYVDTETCGFHGPVVLVQYADKEDRDIILHDVWDVPINETLALYEEICDKGIIGFNLAFDWFHICQQYTTLLLHSNKHLPPQIEEYARLEAQACSGPCMKPRYALDLMLHARKGRFQSTMDRSDIRIRRVPTMIAEDLSRLLTNSIPMPDLYFARRKDPSIRWQVMDILNEDGEIVPLFKDIVLKFSPSMALKTLAMEALGHKEDLILKFVDVEVPAALRPVELGYAPYATAIGEPGAWNGAWPEVIGAHIRHWKHNKYARKYASDDILYTYELDDFFGNPEYDDYDSTLACMAGAVRWKGYKIDSEMLSSLRNTAQDKVNKSKYNFNSVEVCRRYLMEKLTEVESAVIIRDGKVSTKGMILEALAKWRESTVCDDCGGMGCDKCEDGEVMSETLHPAALRAEEILEYRRAKKEIELYDKLLTAGRFHASFKIIGALSGRMSGSDGLNAQGIKHDKEVRACFPLKDDDMILTAGDFSGFEVCLADAVYGDTKLHEQLLTGYKIHGLFGAKLFAPMTYDEILATDGMAGDKNKYGRSKNCVFALLYGGEAYTLSTRGGVPEKIAEKAYQDWVADYPEWGMARKKLQERFCTMRQKEGLGSMITWSDPDDYMESMFGFKRYFTLENQVAKVLFDIAEKPPKSWQSSVKVVRRDREQTAAGAARSAVFAAAFQIQAANFRAASNHEIQSSGAEMTKILQRNIWNIQPEGINNWRVQPMNIHDEIMSPTHPSYVKAVRKEVDDFIEEYKPRVPLLAIDWHDSIENWSQK